MQRHRRLVEGVRNGAVCLRIILRFQLGLWPLPHCARRVDLFPLAAFPNKLDGEEDVIGVGRNNAPDL